MSVQATPPKLTVPKLSIIIPHRGLSIGLWATIHSCYEALSDADLTYEFIVMSNGDEKPAVDVVNTAGYLEQHKLGKFIHTPEVLAPHTARQRGAAESTGDILVFFDNHCLVDDTYFKRIALEFESPEVSILHSGHRFYLGEPICYHYQLKLAYNFWGTSSGIPQHPYKRYPIACGGHGGFCVRRTVWDDIGGYGPENLLEGYGGEELLLNLKAWRYGYKTFLHPRLVHYHFAGVRGYTRHYSDDYYRNMMVTAFVTGGEKWLYKLFHSFNEGNHVRINPEVDMYDLLQAAYERGRDYAAEVEKRSEKSLDELLHWFRLNQVAM